MSDIKLILCAYHLSGCKVLEHIIQRKDISDVAIFTHNPLESVSDIRIIAKKNSLFCSTENINNTKLPFKADIIASVYYRFIIKKHIIDSVGGMIFNLHPSLLPYHRGCSSVPWAIIDDDKITGITYHYVDSGIDTGKIILQAIIPITKSDTQLSLYNLCMEKGVQFWPAAFELVKSGFPGIEQEGNPSYHPRGAPYMGQIDDNWPVEKIERFIRAMTYPPYPYAKYKEQPIRTIHEYLNLLSKEKKE